MSPILHLICNAHLDPVWQWRWDEGASEALATFRNAVAILDEHPSLVFCHNEAVLYQWAERLDPALFDDIRRLVRAGRWDVSGGWFIQPDVNLPGTESLIRTIAAGRRYFRDRFGAAPRVAYNFDSFGHGGGLPQVLRLAGYEMYIHMRPQAAELPLPADLYRWRGVDGTIIPAYRIAVGLYHTEHDNIEARLAAGVDLALKLGRDVPVFWGLGNHGGGATRRGLAAIQAFAARESRVRLVHSTPDRFFEAVQAVAATAPIHDGDLQRSFTGCYTSLSRLKRRAVTSLGGLVQAEAAAAAAFWLGPRRAAGPPSLEEAWNLHIFNDFHDILTGTCIEPAERDALDQYGAAAQTCREAALASLTALSRGSRNSPSLPVTVFNANPFLRRVPVEFECMADHRPFWKGTWRMRLFRSDGREVPCQEEQPESLLPFNNWRRRISFVDELAGVGVSRYYLKAVETSGDGGRQERGQERGHVPEVHVPIPPPVPPTRRGDQERGHVPVVHVPGSAAGSAAPSDRRAGSRTGPIAVLAAFARYSAGPLFEPLVIEDDADSWGTGRARYRTVAGRFKPSCRPSVIEHGPVRTITRSVLAFGRSRIVRDAVVYPSWPVVEIRFRVTWNEERRRLKLRLPTGLARPSLLVEVPGGAIGRPADGQEHVHGRWLVIEGRSSGAPLAIGLASSGQHGLDFKDAELRLSVLRASAYCHERGFDLGTPDKGTRTLGTCPQVHSQVRPDRGASEAWKFADIGVHEFRLLVTAGAPAAVRAMMPGLADLLAAPPAAFAHLPFDAARAPAVEPLLFVKPSNIRLLACKRSWDGRDLIVRLHEAVGKRTAGRMMVMLPAGRVAGHPPKVTVPLTFAPFEIKTLRVDRSGACRPVRLIEED